MLLWYCAWCSLAIFLFLGGSILDPGHHIVRLFEFTWDFREVITHHQHRKFNFKYTSQIHIAPCPLTTTIAEGHYKGEAGWAWHQFPQRKNTNDVSWFPINFRCQRCVWLFWMAVMTLFKEGVMHQWEPNPEKGFIVSTDNTVIRCIYILSPFTQHKLLAGKKPKLYIEWIVQRCQDVEARSRRRDRHFGVITEGGSTLRWFMTSISRKSEGTSFMSDSTLAFGLVIGLSSWKSHSQRRINHRFLFTKCF